MPSRWPRLLEETSGGYFHSPICFEADNPDGTLLFGVYGDEREIMATVVCLESSCRLGWRSRHVRVPSLPAIGRSHRDSGGEILGALIEALGARGAAEVSLGSFDAEWVPSSRGIPGEPGPLREEFRVPLEDPSDLLSAMGSSHRRKVRKGEAADWELRVLDGEEGSDALHRVQVAAARRSRERGDGFSPGDPVHLGADGGSDAWPWCGVRVFGAFAGDELLSADLVGWAAGRAFYVRGGSTPRGYELAAAFWAHWQIMSRLRASGLTLYNMGGVPAGAAERGHPQHGLWRFKKDFGGTAVTCRGWKALLRPGHVKLHGVLNRLRGG